MLVDSHCHLDRLDLSRFGNGLAGVLDAALGNGVCCLGKWGDAAVERGNGFGKLAGARPHDRALSPNCPVGGGASQRGWRPCADREGIGRAGPGPASGRHRRNRAIGETGLDYYYGCDSAIRQQDWFRIHVAAARELGKPLIVHTRDARADTLRILEEEGAAEIGGVLHCFTEDWAMAERALELGFYISFSGIVTFKNAGQIQGETPDRFRA